MDETPNDSGELPAEIDSEAPAAEVPVRTPREPIGQQLSAAIRRPSVWGLLLLIAVVIVVQIWLLFL